AIAALQKARRLTSDDAWINHYLAWLLAICPDPKVRNPKQAVMLAEMAVKAAPNDANYLRALGMALYYAGDYQAAMATLTRSVELRKESMAYDDFPLAMAHHRLGHKEEARKWYEQGLAWIEKNQHMPPPHPEKLALLRADAEALLGIQTPTKPAPDKTP